MPQAPNGRVPGVITLPDGRRYVATVFKIEDRDEKNRPENCILIPDDRQVELHGGEEFMICYVPEKMVNRQQLNHSGAAIN